MKKKFLSLLLVVVSALCACVGCNNPNESSSSSSATIEAVDYVSQLKLDENSASQKLEVTVKMYIDGDTTHFYPKNKSDVSSLPEKIQEDGFIKARYSAVNTPESTGTIEEWGQAASDFTHEKLQSAASIIIETEEDDWALDSTSERYVLWVWYKPKDATDYRNLNLELLQEGLGRGTKAGTSRYGELCTKAIAQAKALALHVYSKEKDPDFYYGTAVPVTLKELRTNLSEYVGKRVAFEGVVAALASGSGGTVYIEDWDDETQMSYGMTIYYGFQTEFNKFLALGNKVHVVGNLTYSENFGYQVSSLHYDAWATDDPDNIKKLGTGYSGKYNEVSVETFNSQKTITLIKETMDPETGEIKTETKTKTMKFAELALSTTLSMKDLRVVDMYTTNNGGDNDGAISITCEDASGNKVDIRIDANIKENGKCVYTESDFEGKTIDVKGVVETYNGGYQLKVYLKDNVTIH